MYSVNIFSDRYLLSGDCPARLVRWLSAVHHRPPRKWWLIPLGGTEWINIAARYASSSHGGYAVDAAQGLPVLFSASGDDRSAMRRRLKTDATSYTFLENL